MSLSCEQQTRDMEMDSDSNNIGRLGVSSELCGKCSGHSSGTILLSMGLFGIGMATTHYPSNGHCRTFSSNVQVRAMMMFNHTKHQ